MNEVWTIAEQFEGVLKAVSFELLAWGRKLADKLTVNLVSVYIGGEINDERLGGLISRGADTVIACADKRLEGFNCVSYARLLERLAREHRPAVILGAATHLGRSLMPYTAVRLRTGLTADCTGLDIEAGTDALLQTRPAIGGNIMAVIKTRTRPQMATVRPKSMRPLEQDTARRGRIIRIPLDETLQDKRVKVEGLRREEGDKISVEDAEIVVAGGRGLKRAENFAMIRELAQSLGGAVGASRDAVDRGWISYPHQVGLSGKTISPRLYMGVGISGAIQHLAGIKTSEVIVSVNPDPEAPLHLIADLGIVGDAFQVIPAFRKKLAEKAMEKMENK
ncbi:MAG: electron transfer flavoprotein subunit alpha/FixB family protein [Treponema sp.]|jgi:electron transfer flavoprotein alpha subunit|nr:electron transfer flavoprotein subunit alpha/FixB family protein [Treponema sp.]